MLKAITNNPYRILGVYSNSPKKEQIANKGKMQAFLRVNKSMPFKLDLQGILPEIQRTQALVDYADSELALSAGQIRHAQFWFINQTHIDGIAFNHLVDGQLDSAIEFWEKSTNFSSLHNLFICYLIKGDYKTAIVYYAIPLYRQYAKEFVMAIDEKSTISTNTLIHTVIETLSNEGVDFLQFSDSISDNTWKSHIEEEMVNPLITKLNTAVSDAKATRGKDLLTRLLSGNNLMRTSKPLLSQLRDIISKDDTRYQMITDKVAQEVLQCGIDYFNDSKDSDSPKKAVALSEYALSIAVGNAARQRCKENHKVIKEAFENMPPEEVAKEAKEIDSILSRLSKWSKTSSNGLTLLKKAKGSLITIKEKLGKEHNYYLEISSTLANVALSFVIEEVNEAQKEKKNDNPFDNLFRTSSRYHLYSDILGEQERRRQKAYTIKTALHDAWQTIVYIDLMDTTEDFRRNRYLPNRKTLYSLIDGLKGFNEPDYNYIIKGCAYGVSADERFFWSDSEYFNSCSSKSGYKYYLQLFPSGIHAEEAKQRIADIEKFEAKMKRYIIIAVIVMILSFIVAIMANAKTCSRDIRFPSIYSSIRVNSLLAAGGTRCKDLLGDIIPHAYNYVFHVEKSNNNNNISEDETLFISNLISDHN